MIEKTATQTWAYHPIFFPNGKVMDKEEARALKSKDSRWCSSPAEFTQKDQNSEGSVAKLVHENAEYIILMAEASEEINALKDIIATRDRELVDCNAVIDGLRALEPKPVKPKKT